MFKYQIIFTLLYGYIPALKPHLLYSLKVNVFSICTGTGQSMDLRPYKMGGIEF